MTRDRFLSQTEVAAFVAWLAGRLPNLAEWFERYHWPFHVHTLYPCAGASFDDSAAVLGRLSIALRQSLGDPRDIEGLRDACIAVMEWGGVTNRNVAWLQANSGALHATLGNGCHRLDEEQDEIAREHAVGRFNAGMTKVYSLLRDGFVIYDSRVAAAVACHVQAWWSESGLAGSRDSLLAFRCMRARTYNNEHRRNPDPALFPWMRTNSQWVQWNIRASWVLDAALAQDTRGTFQQRHPNAPLRALESALFMMGYDLDMLPT